SVAAPNHGPSTYSCLDDITSCEMTTQADNCNDLLCIAPPRDAVRPSPTPIAARLKRRTAFTHRRFQFIFPQFSTALRPQSCSLHATHATHSNPVFTVPAISATLVHT